MKFGKKNKELSVPNAPLGEFGNVAPAPAEKPENTRKGKPDDKKKQKRPNIFKRIGRSFKEMFSELKKVTWPHFPKVLKQTGVVLVIVAVFLLVLLAFDLGLTELFKLLVDVE